MRKSNPRLDAIRIVGGLTVQKIAMISVLFGAMLLSALGTASAGLVLDAGQGRLNLAERVESWKIAMGA